MKFKINNNIFYNFAKDIYYKYFAYKKYPLTWHKDYLETNFNGTKLKFVLYKKNNVSYYSSKFLNEEIAFPFELESYVQTRDIKNNDIVIDCGAYHGAFTIYASKKVGPEGKVIAYEPDPDNFKILKRNILINNCKNVIAINKGVFNKNKKLKFKQEGIASRITNSGDIIIYVTKLDSSLKLNKISPKAITFIKMDIEGAEIEAVDGAKDILTKGTPHVVIASYHIVNNEMTYKEIEKKLKKLGYQVKTGHSHLVTTGTKEIK